jgi:hypothetical protein
MLTVGVRPRLLYGLATFATENNSTILSTSHEEWNLNTDISGKLAITGVPIPLDTNGNLDFKNIDLKDAYSSPSKIMNSLGKNRGLAIDFGVQFRPINQFQFSLSVLDIGSLSWKGNTNISSFKGNYTFRGFPWKINTDSTTTLGQRILDTLRKDLNLTNTSTGFKTQLYPKIIAGGRIFITKGFDVGLLSKTEFLPTKTDQDFIVMADLHPVDAFSLSASYSLLGKGHTSIGVGLGLRIGPANTYYIFDNIPLVYNYIHKSSWPIKIPVPVDFYKFSFRIGANFTLFGTRHREKKKTQDRPLFNSTDWNY